MIIDSIQNAELYQQHNSKFKQAFEFIMKSDLKTMANGTYPIDGEEVFAIVQEYQTKLETQAKLESHHQYIDIQYMITGSEKMGYALKQNQEIIENHPDKDLIFYRGNYSMLQVAEQMFTIFFPNDLHMPGVIDGEKKLIKKVVVKLKV